jgi:hypothetical protein
MSVVTQPEPYSLFAQRHGARPMPVNNQFIFPDGAVCSADRDIREEPPTDRRQFLLLRRDYLREFASETADGFARAKSDGVRQPHQCYVDIMTQLKDDYHTAMAELEAIDAELATMASEPTDPETLRLKRAAEWRREEEQRAAQALAAIKSLEL